jgi:hypothetical protein
MGKVLRFHRKEPVDETAEKLVAMSAEIDRVILKYLNDPDVDPGEIAGLISHRLGSLMRHIDKKSELWDVCQRVLRRQANLE